MILTKNIKVGNLSKFLISLIFCIFFIQLSNAKSNVEFIGTNTDIKILDKISSKNDLIKLNEKKQYVLSTFNFKKILPYQTEAFRFKAKFIRKVLNLLVIS